MSGYRTLRLAPEAFSAAKSAKADAFSSTKPLRRLSLERRTLPDKFRKQVTSSRDPNQLGYLSQVHTQLT